MCLCWRCAAELFSDDQAGDKDVGEEGLTYEQIKAMEEREEQLRKLEAKFGSIPKSSLLNIPTTTERGKRHIATEYDPEFDKGRTQRITTAKISSARY